MTTKPVRDAEDVSDPRVEILGFTGTREGMTEAQKTTVSAILDDPTVVEVHHGDCLGADDDFDRLAQYRRLPRVIHPPSNPKLRAWCTSLVEMFPERPYLERNRDIVDACTTLVATPKEDAEQYDGGTWYTVHHARKQGKRTIVVWPDGSTLIDGQDSQQEPEGLGLPTPTAAPGGTAMGMDRGGASSREAGPTDGSTTEGGRGAPGAPTAQFDGEVS